MYIQGDLQAVFDALYALGVIDPILEKDWQKTIEETPNYEVETVRAVSRLNECLTAPRNLMESLKKLDTKTLEFIAMEVAKEFADYYSRKVTH